MQLDQHTEIHIRRIYSVCVSVGKNDGEWQTDGVFMYLCVFVQVWRDNFPIIPSTAVAAVGVIIRSIRYSVYCLCAVWLRCAARPHDMYLRLKPSHCCVGAVRRHAVYKAGEGRRSRNSKGSKALSLAAWLAYNWVAKKLYAAIRTLGEVYRTLSFKSIFLLPQQRGEK